MTEDNNELSIRYVPLSQCVAWLWAHNPKLYDTGALVESFTRHGFKEPPRYDPKLNDGKGGFSSGNGRIEALEGMKQQFGIHGMRQPMINHLRAMWQPFRYAYRKGPLKPIP